MSRRPVRRSARRHRDNSSLADIVDRLVATYCREYGKFALQPPDATRESLRRLRQAPAADPRRQLWEAIAARVMEAGVTPEQFIRAQFVVAPPDREPPSPRKFDAAQAIDNVRLANEFLVMEFAHDLSRQQELAANQIVALTELTDLTKYEAWADALADDTVAVSPLFRHCLATAIAATEVDGEDAKVFRRIASVYETEAMRQYVPDAAQYDKAWGHTWINPHFAYRARCQYRQ